VHLLDPCSDPVFGLNFFRHRPGVDPAVTASMAADAVSAVWGGEDLHAKPLLTETLKMIFWSLDWLGATLLEADELTDIADDNPLRAYVIENAPNRAVRRFWRSIEALPPAKRDEKLAAAARRLGEVLLPQATGRIFAGRDRVLDFRAAVDDGGCLLIYRSVMTNTRTKIIFGGLDDDDATLMAKNLYRRTLDPELAKIRFDKPTVTGQVREWMGSESDSRGTAFDTGSTASYGGSQAT